VISVACCKLNKSLTLKMAAELEERRHKKNLTAAATA
jgi:hypothetical protein